MRGRCAKCHKPVQRVPKAHHDGQLLLETEPRHLGRWQLDQEGRAWHHAASHSGLYGQPTYWTHSCVHSPQEPA